MNITGHFLSLAYRIAPYVLCTGGLILGANAEPPSWLIGKYQVWGAVIMVILGYGFARGAADAHVKEAT